MSGAGPPYAIAGSPAQEPDIRGRPGRLKAVQGPSNVAGMGDKMGDKASQNVKAGREERLAQALRENLRRRKAQAKERRGGAGGEGGGDSDAGPSGEKA